MELWNCGIGKDCIIGNFRRFVELWNCGIVELWNYGIAKFRNFGRIVEVIMGRMKGRRGGGRE